MKNKIGKNTVDEEGEISLSIEEFKLALVYLQQKTINTVLEALGISKEILVLLLIGIILILLLIFAFIFIGIKAFSIGNLNFFKKINCLNFFV